MFSDLAKITHNDITACDKMADWLADKLKKPEPVMKWKVCLYGATKSSSYARLCWQSLSMNRILQTVFACCRSC